MNVDQWEDTYQPIQNTIDEYASWNGQMFDTYGNDENIVIGVATLEPRRVWTLVDTDNGYSIINGMHWVNRVGYFITEKQWDTGATIEVPVTNGDVFV